MISFPIHFYLLRMSQAKSRIDDDEDYVDVLSESDIRSEFTKAEDISQELIANIPTIASVDVDKFHLSDSLPESSRGVCDLCPNDLFCVVTDGCLNCRQKLCAKCASIHKNSSDFVNHHVVDIAKYETDVINAPETKCPIHTSESEDVYCGICDIFCCRLCYEANGHAKQNMLQNSLGEGKGNSEASILDLQKKIDELFGLVSNVQGMVAKSQVSSEVAVAPQVENKSLLASSSHAKLAETSVQILLPGVPGKVSTVLVDSCVQRIGDEDFLLVATKTCVTMISTTTNAFVRKFAKGMLKSITGICVSAGAIASYLYVSDLDSKAILVFDIATGRFAMKIEHPQIKQPRQIAVVTKKDDSLLFVQDKNKIHVVKALQSNVYCTSFGVPLPIFSFSVLPEGFNAQTEIIICGEECIASKVTIKELGLSTGY